MIFFAATARHSGPEGLSIGQLWQTQIGYAAAGLLQTIWAYCIYSETQRKVGSERPLVRVAAILLIIIATSVLFYLVNLSWRPEAPLRLGDPLNASALNMIALIGLACSAVLYWSSACSVVHAERTDPHYAFRESIITTIWLVFPIIGVWLLRPRLAKILLPAS